MLPDFSGLRQQSSDEADLRSLEHTSDSHLSPSQSSQQFETERDGEAFQGNRTASTIKERSTPLFIYVEETLNEFLDLWPHRFDYLYASHPDPGTKPNWKTETSHPLSDRLINQGAYLYGVRLGPKTAYGLLDIDRGSPYHPRRDPLALNRICEALEPLGLVRHLDLTSSDSQGLHIYFPCGEPLPSWQLALAITALLENAGFKIKPGWLEVFPKRKPFTANGNVSLFSGHRLPLQQGSYLLNDDLQPLASSHQAFVREWHLATALNDINTDVLKQTIRQARRETYRVSGKAQKFINDLQAEIEPGWSGSGQTNHLLGRIAMRSYIFGHILYADAPLSGQTLIDDIVSIARALPGFKDYCGHQHDLVKKAKAWAIAIENESRYFPYGVGKSAQARKSKPSGPTWNQQQMTEARLHIQQLVKSLSQQDTWPSGITARFNLLCTASISGSTLYKNRDLWHPVYTGEQQRQLGNRPSPQVLHMRIANACAGGAALAIPHTSLLGKTGCNSPADNAFSAQMAGVEEYKLQIGCSTLPVKGSESFDGDQTPPATERTAPPEQLALNIQWALQVARANQQAKAVENRQQYRQAQQQRAKDEHRVRLLAWVDSGDPILVAEAQQQLGRLVATANRTKGSG